MSASDFLSVAVDGKSAVISKSNFKDIDDFTVVGSSLRMSVDPGSRVSSCVLALERPGIVAVAVNGWLNGGFGKNVHRFAASDVFFISVTNEEGKWDVVLHKSFIPPPDRLPQIIDRNYIEVRTGENGIFTTKPDVPGTKYVKDANLLCRFLVDAAKVEDLNAAAEEVAAEKSTCENFVQSKLEVTQLLEENQDFQNQIRQLEARVVEWKAKAEEQTAAATFYFKQATAWSYFGSSVRSYLFKKWPQTGRVRALLAEERRLGETPRFAE